MEFLNRLEIRGIVGRAEYSETGGSHLCRFSVVTEYNYRGRDGNPVMESTWFNVSAWEGKGSPDLSQIHKGSWIRIVGRIRTYKYSSPEGEERSSWEVFANRVELLEPEDGAMQPQRYM